MLIASLPTVDCRLKTALWQAPYSYSLPPLGYFSRQKRRTFVPFISIKLLKHENFIFFPENHAFGSTAIGDVQQLRRR